MERGRISGTFQQILQATHNAIKETAIEEIIAILQENGNKVRVEGELWLGNEFGDSDCIYCEELEYCELVGLHNTQVVLTDDGGNEYYINNFEHDEVVSVLVILEDAITCRELCPHCEQETRIGSNMQPYQCKYCGSYIAPCSQCENKQCANCKIVKECEKLNQTSK